MTTRRLALVLLSAALLVLSDPARAQPRPSTAQLECMIAKALKDPETVTFARPQILGFGDEPVVTHQLHHRRPELEHSFAVTNPRLSDGLVFFSYQPVTRTYRMHRTEMHLRRITSATNDLKRGDEGLVGWDGAAADNDFDSQLGIWADFDCPGQVAAIITPRSSDNGGLPPGRRPSAR